MRIAIGLAAVCVLTLFMAGAALAAEKLSCACTAAEFNTRVQNADRIFLGTVTKIFIPEDLIQPGRKDPPAIVTFRVSEGYKDADAGRTATLHTSLTRTTCAGHDFALGEEYLVFAYRRRASTYEHWSLYDFKTGTYDVGGLCGGTRPSADPETAEDIRRLLALKASGADILRVEPEPEL
jgi:hypothetical protein